VFTYTGSAAQATGTDFTFSAISTSGTFAPAGTGGFGGQDTQYPTNDLRASELR
jgi:hypothetical protein